MQNNEQATAVRKVLNVGGNNKNIAIPAIYDGWQHDLLDIDPRGNPDLLCDARELMNTTPRVYDAVYCSHNLEHYYQHDVLRVLAGFKIVLKKDGFAHIAVPDIFAVMKRVVENGLDLGDVLYVSAAGPIRVHDVIYGFGVEIERSGNDFFAHKCGFSRSSLVNALTQAGFGHVYTSERDLAIEALAFTQKPTEEQARLLGLG